MDNLECSEQIGKPTSINDSRAKKQQNQKLDFNNFALLKDPKLYLSKIHEFNQSALQKIRNQQFQQAVKLLVKAEQMITLGKNVCKNIHSELKICVYYNLACAYQGIWNLQKCNKFCQIVSQQIQQNIKSIEIENKQKIVKFNMQLLKLKLQHCAILSQLGQHQKAYQMSKLSLKILKQSLQILYQFTKTFKQSQILPNDYRDRVAFSFSAGKYVDLLKQLIIDLSTQIQSKKIDTKPFFYYWKSNPENNQKHIKKQFTNKKKFSRQQQSRTILGVQSESQWIQQFNIGTIMHMSPMTEKQLLFIPSFFQQITKKNLYQKVIYSSVLHFTIATQIRFIELQIQKQKQIKNKYIGQVKSQAYAISQIYHLKAIQIMCKGISTCSPYLNHLISSYHKHYVQSLRSIQEHEQSYISQLQITKKIQQFQDQIQKTDHNEDYYNKSKHNNLNVSQEGFQTKNYETTQNVKQQIENVRIQIQKLKKQQFNQKNLKKQKRKSEQFIQNQSASKITVSSRNQKSKSSKKQKKVKHLNKMKSPEDINLIKCKSKTKSTNKIPLSIIKKAFNSKNFKDLQPNQITLTQKTSTQINVVLKKKSQKTSD